MVDTDPDSRVGCVLDGRYKVLERLAEGGMGVVYRAERLPVGRPVAVKFLHQVFASDRESRARFERETRVLSKLTHPHCVSVIDFGVDGGPYLVMDFVTGATLKDRLEAGPIPAMEAITIARQTLAGLAHAHAQGITHRDVKPANIMVSDEIGTGNHVRILDFGLARLRGSAATSVTSSSIVVGTPNYMAPEQTLAGEVDARTDVYAMGVVLFEMVTGQRPFSADDTAGVLDAHRNQPPPHVSEVAPDLEIPPGLDRVIQRALKKDPDDRYQSAVEMANALEAIAEGRRAPQTEPGVSASRRPPATSNVIMFLLVLLGGAIAAYVMIGRGDDRRSTGIPAGTGSALAGGTAAGTTAARDALPTPLAATADAAALAIVPTEAVDAATAALAVADAEAAAMIATSDAAPAITDPTAGSGSGSGSGSAVAITTPGAVDADPAEIDLTVEEVAAADPTEAPPEQVQPDDDETTPTPTPTPTPPPTTAPVAPAKTVAQAIAMARRGQREPAIEGLRALWRKNPRDGRYPFTLANLYFEKRWWSIAMEHYGAAIKASPGYRGNGTMIRNVIQALGHPKTRGKAYWFLKRVVGKWARPYLRTAAKSNPKPQIRSAARSLLR